MVSRVFCHYQLGEQGPRVCAISPEARLETVASHETQMTAIGRRQQVGRVEIDWWTCFDVVARKWLLHTCSLTMTLG